MRIGTTVGAGPGGFDGIAEQLQELETAGFATAWMPQIFGWDALTALAVAGRSTARIEIGTGVVPTYPRHPAMLASQALTTNAALDGRLALGIGLSHQVVIEDMFGLSFDRPAVHMKDYLNILGPLLRERRVSYDGATLRAHLGLDIPVEQVAAPVVLVAALADRMLKLAGSLADGTILWMTGPATVADHIVPLVTKAATDAGRPPPRVVVGLPFLLTNDTTEARERANRTFAIYGQLPSYRAMLDREGATNPADVAIVGDEAALRAGLERVRDAGATDVNAAPFGTREEIERTLAFLASHPI